MRKSSEVKLKKDMEEYSESKGEYSQWRNFAHAAAYL